MKVIITGATGFVGRNLAESLCDNGEEVVATGRSPEVGRKLKDRGLNFKPADIRNAKQVAQVISSADCIVHSAARSGDWGKYQDFFQDNVIGTRNVIAACRKHEVRKIIFISTPSIYFSGEDRLDIAESDPLPGKQMTSYSKTKLVCEKELMALTDEGFSVAIFRPRAVYGPYDNTIVPRILKLAERKQMPLINNGQALTDITYIDNLIDAVKSCMRAPESAWNEIYNISNGDPVTIKDWFATVLEIFERPFNPRNVPIPVAKTVAAITELRCRLPFGPEKPSMTRFSVGYMSRSMTMSIEKAREKLNYSPSVSNRRGFELYADWYRESEQRISHHGAH